ncbi:hypothetical protein FFWV33_08640 [Flavobacterium faecale]|uniref:Uncharacterized protein n=1 Tax=Flavobacterium faecale TaxID=1355330 RepID=A0A2S1LCY7_9FLAO|nr:hypothetical protein [Flavobacterium faecale]AWG21594.1 hypothetical protein FFWV33_08640 [Flavobacterium faecale]
MKKIIALVAICLFTINMSAQEKKCCAKKEDCAKNMTAKEVAACKAKCKAEGKTCDATTASAKAHANMTPKEIEACKAKCKAEGKTCDVAVTKVKKVAKKECCAKKA